MVELERRGFSDQFAALPIDALISAIDSEPSLTQVCAKLLNTEDSRGQLQSPIESGMRRDSMAVDYIGDPCMNIRCRVRTSGQPIATNSTFPSGSS